MSSLSPSVETVSRTNTSQKRQLISESSGVQRATDCSGLRKTLDSSVNIDIKKSGIAVLLDMADFKCICCHSDHRGYIYQCSNGHSICSVCHGKKLQRCAICRGPIPPFHRNLAMEGVLEVLRVPCPNAEYGCSEYLPFDASNDEFSEHLGQCLFIQCPCPFRICKFNGSYHELSEHCVITHRRSLKIFECGNFLTIKFGTDDRVVLKEKLTGGKLVVVDRFNEEGGTKITSTIFAKCIALKVPGMGNCNIRGILLSKIAGRICWESGDIRRILGVPRASPNSNFLPVSSYMERCSDLTISLCIQQRTGGNPGASTSTVRLV